MGCRVCEKVQELRRRTAAGARKITADVMRRNAASKKKRRVVL